MEHYLIHYLQKTPRSDVFMSTKEKQKRGTGAAAVVIILCVAALAAEGETEISDLSHIDRGYQCMEGDLTALGADVKRTEDGSG